MQAPRNCTIFLSLQRRITCAQSNCRQRTYKFKASSYLPTATYTNRTRSCLAMPRGSAMLKQGISFIAEGLYLQLLRIATSLRMSACWRLLWTSWNIFTATSVTPSMVALYTCTQRKLLGPTCSKVSKQTSTSHSIESSRWQIMCLSMTGKRKSYGRGWDRSPSQITTENPYRAVSTAAQLDGLIVRVFRNHDVGRLNLPIAPRQVRQLYAVARPSRPHARGPARHSAGHTVCKEFPPFM